MTPVSLTKLNLEIAEDAMFVVVATEELRALIAALEEAREALSFYGDRMGSGGTAREALTRLSTLVDFGGIK